MMAIARHKWKIVVFLVVISALGVWDANRVKPIASKRVDLGNGVTMDFVWIPPGEFMMGSPTNEVGRFDNETQHRVKISKGFWMGKCEVTQKQFMAVMGTNLSTVVEGRRYPADSVSWNDAVAFCAKVKDRTGLEMRLPTEAEWEYACRAGTTTAYNTGDTEADLDRAACFDGNSRRGFKIWKWDLQRKGPRRVGRYAPNAWGLYDMHGNLWDWCADGYADYPEGDLVDPTGAMDGSRRVLRGGSWNFNAQYCRSAYRYYRDPSSRYDFVGFRCVLAR